MLGYLCQKVYILLPFYSSMRRGFGIGLLLLASSLLLVTLGVTLTVPGSYSFLGSLELIILLLIQVAIMMLLFADKNWGISHLLVFMIAALGIGFSINAYLSGAGNLEILAIIALDLLGFLLAIFGATEMEPKVPRRQTKLDKFQTFEPSGAQTIIYEAEKEAAAEVEEAKEIIKQAVRKASAKKSTKKAKKKTAKKSTKKAAKKTTKKTVKKNAKKTVAKKSEKAVKPTKKTTKKAAKKKVTKTVKKKETPKKTILVEKKIETHF